LRADQDEQIAIGRAAKRLALVKLRTLMTSGRRIRKKPGSNSQKPEGGSKFSKAIKCMLKLHACEKALSDAVQKECDDEEEHYGRIPDRVVPDTTFQERQFGDLITRHRARDFPCSVVSIALFDGATMLFSC